MSLIPAVAKNEILLEQAQSFENDNDHFHIWWLGQSGYLLLWQGKRILIDPYLSDSLTRKYADTKKPHIRMSEKAMEPGLLKNISIVSSSHNHTDHLDAETLIPVIRNNPGIHFIIPEANRAFVANRVQCDETFPTGLNEGNQFSKEGFTFHGLAAAHNSLDKNEKGECLYMGYIIQFGKWTIYHSGDTLWYAGLENTLKDFKIDLALLPVNGNDPARGVAGNLNAKEAAELAKAAGIKHVIPCHYDMFTFNTANPANFSKEAEAIGQPYTILPIGGHWSSSVI
ncbi:MAG: MBL fold metallo-hydrolase [Chitinophagaceae bacterium]|nr:MBL fold metallo-hydrolase [Chitinophagaceae bacterium]